MIIKFSMDHIKNMEQIYKWTPTYFEEFDCNGIKEYYYGIDYCKQIINDILRTLNWGTQEYLGTIDRLAKEVFNISTEDDKIYRIDFEINTYERKAARLECTITTTESNEYDQKLEDLKIALKNRLILDWKMCTWLIDMQSAQLCTEAYEKAFIVENNLRAFASKVLIHFLGIDWINCTGLERVAESVNYLKQKFTQRVPEFENINSDFLSMTLETLMGVIIDGKVYSDDVVLNKVQYEKVLDIAQKSKTANSIAEFIKSKRTVEKTIWDDLFVPFIDEPDKFKQAIHNFIEDRNHVAHSKILSWSSYQVVLNEFNNMDDLIRMADSNFDIEETSDEVMETWSTFEEGDQKEREYYRERLAIEAGIDILSERNIRDWFNNVLHSLYSDVYQRYHLDVSYEISGFESQNSGACFTVISPVMEDNSLRVDVMAEYCIDDELGGDSTCKITCKDCTGKIVCFAEIYFHNGNGYENEEGLMEASEDSGYNTSELVDFKEQLFEYIDEELNPYPTKLNTHVYENKGDNEWTGDFACDQCGKNGVSINEEFLPIGKCCYCGWNNELEKCERCGAMVNFDDIDGGLCLSCAAYVQKE
ncbi:hypothetical protein [Holdemanella biformis]